MGLEVDACDLAQGGQAVAGGIEPQAPQVGGHSPGGACQLGDGPRVGVPRQCGRGGLGTAIYDAVRTLDIGKSIDAGIAIIILTIILDRITQAAVKEQNEGRL